MSLYRKSEKLFVAGQRGIIVTVLFFLFLSISAPPCFSQWQNEPISSYEVIEERNIFRPKSEEKEREIVDDAGLREDEEIVVPVPSPVEHFVLTGIVKIRNKYKAIIEKKNGSNGFYVGINETVDDYTVTSIKRDVITMERNGEVFELNLKVAAPKSQGNPVAKPVTNTPSVQKPPPERTKEYKHEMNIMQKLRMGVR